MLLTVSRCLVAIITMCVCEREREEVYKAGVCVWGTGECVWRDVYPVLFAHFELFSVNNLCTVPTDYDLCLCVYSSWAGAAFSIVLLEGTTFSLEAVLSHCL